MCTHTVARAHHTHAHARARAHTHTHIHIYTYTKIVKRTSLRLSPPPFPSPMSTSPPCATAILSPPPPFFALPPFPRFACVRSASIWLFHGTLLEFSWLFCRTCVGVSARSSVHGCQNPQSEGDHGYYQWSRVLAFLSYIILLVLYHIINGLGS